MSVSQLIIMLRSQMVLYSGSSKDNLEKIELLIRNMSELVEKLAENLGDAFKEKNTEKTMKALTKSYTYTDVHEHISHSYKHHRHDPTDAKTELTNTSVHRKEGSDSGYD